VSSTFYFSAFQVIFTWCKKKNNLVFLFFFVINSVASSHFSRCFHFSLFNIVNTPFIHTMNSNISKLNPSLHVPAPMHLLSPVHSQQQQQQQQQPKPPLTSLLVPYIWPTSPASFCTGVVVGLIVALLRPIIEYYVDVGAKYIAVVLRFSLIWGSVGLIAWAILRVLQQTSSTVAPSSVPQQQQQRYLTQNQNTSLPPPLVSSSSSSPMLSSSAESLYSFTTTSSANTSSSTYSNYTPKPPHMPLSAAATGYNPYGARTPSPVRSASPTRMSPTRKMVGPITATSGAITPGVVSASVRRMEPRIVPIDDGSDTGVPDNAGFRNYLRAKDAVSVLEKPIGQGAFRIRRRP
jgi:hypothetical protein